MITTRQHAVLRARGWATDRRSIEAAASAASQGPPAPCWANAWYQLKTLWLWASPENQTGEARPRSDTCVGLPRMKTEEGTFGGSCWDVIMAVTLGTGIQNPDGWMEDISSKLEDPKYFFLGPLVHFASGNTLRLLLPIKTPVDYVWRGEHQ